MNILARAVSDSFASNGGCDHRALIGIEEALSRIADHVHIVPETEKLPLQSTLDRTLASPIAARCRMPRFDHSAMDGYALNASGLKGGEPWTLRVVDRIAAGEAKSTRLEPGMAARIFTGAPIPPGTDRVVMQENVERNGDSILLRKVPRPGENIRKAGEEHEPGDEILSIGTRISARAIAAAAAAGEGALEVVREIRVALLVSGSEVVQPGTVEPAEGQIWDVNTPMLCALMARAGIDLVRVNAIPDNFEATARALAIASEEVDLVISSGGISVGEEDHVSRAIAAIGGTVQFSGVSIKPGKPVSFGRIGNASWLGLPGNPLSAFVTWHIFGEAVLRGFLGQPEEAHTRRSVSLGHSLSRKPGRTELRPAFIASSDHNGEVIHCFENVTSGQVSGLAKADGLAILPSKTGRLHKGASVEFLPFSNR